MNINKQMRDSMILEKYYIAGHSARWMFAQTTKSVIDAISYYIDQVGNVTNLLNGTVWIQSRDSANHLLFYYGTYDGLTKKFFVSKYVAKKLLESGNTHGIKLAYNIADALNNSSFTGWIVELISYRRSR
jgi:hypothetical protein